MLIVRKRAAVQGVSDRYNKVNTKSHWWTGIWMPGREVKPSGWARILKRCGVAFGAVAIAFAIRYITRPVLGEELPFTLFIAAALVAAWYGGAVTGVAALLFGLLAADYFLVEPPKAIDLAGKEAWVHIARYLFTASVGIVLIEVLHRARRRTERALAEARLEAERRKRSEEELREAHDLLADHASRLDRTVEERTAELQMSVNSLQEILYNIAHCLRAPARAAGSFSQILQDQYSTVLDAEGQEHLGRIRQAAERLEALMQDILDFGSVAQERLSIGPLKLDELIRNVAQEREGKYARARASLEVEGRLPEVNASAELTERIVSELLLNALKFRRNDRELRVRIWAEERGRRIRVWFADNGPGIDPRFRERIFGVFEQLRVVDGADGTGIGLAIVKLGMLRQGGKVGVESEPGEGSRFWIEFSESDGTPGAIPREPRASLQNASL